MGRGGAREGGSVYIDVYIGISICTHEGDATPCQGPPAYGFRDVLADGLGMGRETGGVGLGRGGGSRAGIPDINTSGIFQNPSCLYITTV